MDRVSKLSSTLISVPVVGKYHARYCLKTISLSYDVYDLTKKPNQSMHNREINCAYGKEEHDTSGFQCESSTKASHSSFRTTQSSQLKFRHLLPT